MLTNEDFFHHQRENFSKFHYENDGKILSFHTRQDEWNEVEVGKF